MTQLPYTSKTEAEQYAKHLQTLGYRVVLLTLGPSRYELRVWG